MRVFAIKNEETSENAFLVVPRKSVRVLREVTEDFAFREIDGCPFWISEAGCQYIQQKTCDKDKSCVSLRKV